MSSTIDALMRSWPMEPFVTAAILLATGVYLRGWLLLRRRDRRRWHVGQLAAFLGGLAAIFSAIASPLEPFASLLLQVHMLQHMLLTMVAPPLLWLGSPFFPLLRGLPAPIRTYYVGPLVAARSLRRLFQRLTYPGAALPIYVAVTWLWHTPRGYELGLRSDDWHRVEHACFLASALLFWYPVIRPYPSRPKGSTWLLLPYLILADVQNTLLAAWLTFSSVIIYPHYAQVPRLDGLSALSDQAIAGVLMWGPGSIAFLLPLFWIGVGLLFDSPESRRRKASIRNGRMPQRASAFLPLKVIDPRLRAREQLTTMDRQQAAAHNFDLLQLPGIGRFLRWKGSRPSMQATLGLAAAVVIFDGLRGPQLSPMNLAGVLPWIHWRGCVVFGLLVAGNLFCMTCPFTLPRTLARRWMPGSSRWPRWLRNKWLAVLLIGLFLWSYEAFALWDRPAWTAWIAIGYFVAAFAVDAFFQDAAFCKYVCPIGQFNFVQSLVSPLEVKVREGTICASCRTKECIRGTDSLPGCQTQLFLPRKSGNLDCTFCLDCVQACPHENIGVLAVVPARTLWSDPIRSGIGRFSRRTDIAALAVVLSFGALANAAGMVAPMGDWLDRARLLLGSPAPIVVTSLYYFAALVVLPAVTIGVAAAVSRHFERRDAGLIELATRYSFGLIPLGFSMWLAHYSFHFLTSFATIVPVTQRFSGELGWAGLGKPLWSCACCRPASDWILHLQIVMLDLGLLLSLYTGLRIAERHAQGTWRALGAFAPWGALTLLLFVVGVWIVFQPMQMRGTLGGGG